MCCADRRIRIDVSPRSTEISTQAEYGDLSDIVTTLSSRTNTANAVG
jgi:hypothetical protein